MFIVRCGIPRPLTAFFHRYPNSFMAFATTILLIDVCKNFTFNTLQIASCLILSYLALSCFVCCLSYPALSCLALSIVVLSYLALFSLSWKGLTWFVLPCCLGSSTFTLRYPCIVSHRRTQITPGIMACVYGGGGGDAKNDVDFYELIFRRRLLTKIFWMMWLYILVSSLR